MRATILCFIAVVALASAISAQSPMPVVVPAMTPATAATAAPAARDEGSIQGAVKLLEQIKAANEETLRKQAATLQQLDELEKAADQIKVFTKRS